MQFGYLRITFPIAKLGKNEVDKSSVFFQYTVLKYNYKSVFTTEEINIKTYIPIFLLII